MLSSQTPPNALTICAYDTPNQIGGTSTWLRNLLPRLRNDGIESRVLLLRHFGDCGGTETFLKNCGFDVVSCLNPATSEDRSQWILEQFIAHPTPIFFPNEVLAGYYLIPNLKKGGIKSIGILHSDCDACIAFQDLFVSGEENARLDAVVCVSEVLRQQVISRNNILCRVEKIPCGVELPPFVRQRDPSKLRIVYMGRLCEEAKQISRLTRSLCAVTKAVPNTEAVIYGDGPSRQNVMELIHQHSEANSVSYGGLVQPDEVYPTLREFDVLILLSDYEGLPVCVMEAMACGVVPVCLRTRSGIPELITHQSNGILLDDCSTHFIEQINQLRHNSAFWDSLSKEARNSAEKLWSAERCAQTWNDLITSLGTEAHIQTNCIDGAITLPPVHPLLINSDPRQRKTQLNKIHTSPFLHVLKKIKKKLGIKNFFNKRH